MQPRKLRTVTSEVYGASGDAFACALRADMAKRRPPIKSAAPKFKKRKNLKARHNGTRGRKQGHRLIKTKVVKQCNCGGGGVTVTN